MAPVPEPVGWCLSFIFLNKVRLDAPTTWRGRALLISGTLLEKTLSKSCSRSFFFQSSVYLILVQFDLVLWVVQDPQHQSYWIFCRPLRGYCVRVFTLIFFTYYNMTFFRSLRHGTWNPLYLKNGLRFSFGWREGVLGGEVACVNLGCEWCGWVWT